jgi:hypothetical protein
VPPLSCSPGACRSSRPRASPRSCCCARLPARRR